MSQQNRLLSIKTPLPADEVLLTGFSGAEGISMPFSFELNLVSENNQIAFKEIIGKNVTVTIALPEGKKRQINGYVAHFSHDKTGGEQQEDLHHSTYSATMVSWLWFLTRTVNSRIFQNVTAVQIVEKVFRDNGFNDFRTSGLSGVYQTRDYCVQYHETDFNFISRLLEQEGIFYFFEHEDGKHTLILADSPQAHKPCPEQDTVHCQQSAGSLEDKDVIHGLSWMQQIRFGKYTTKDYDYLSPNTDLKVEAKEGKPLGPGEREYYDFPGEYTTRNEGERLANVRIQAEEAQVTTLNGVSNCRAFASGFRFTLKDYQRSDMNNKPYVLTMVQHEAGESLGVAGTEIETAYSNSFTCIPFDVPYRPAVIAVRPSIMGVQTAIVTGPSNEEIYTDEHGRVKVQFHWDREGKKDDKTTCWIRVAQIWAGQGWGGVWIPRIGNEVVVSFIEGDPDRPLIIGSVYNGANRTPYTLPDEKTKSIIKSNSSKGGGGFNELRFEDEKGNEEIFLHASRNLKTEVIKDETHDVTGNRSLKIQGDDKKDVGGTATMTVVGGLTITGQSVKIKDAGSGVTIQAAGKVTIQASQIEIQA